MKDNRYTVSMTINPEQPNLAYWMCDTLAEARQLFDFLKKGMTAYTITLHLTDRDGITDLECFRMGDEERAATPTRGVDYREMLQARRRDDPGYMIID